MSNGSPALAGSGDAAIENPPYHVPMDLDTTSTGERRWTRCRALHLRPSRSTALPVTLALGIEAGHLKPQEHVGLFGIGSGIHCLMLGIDWQTSPVASESKVARPHFKPAVVKA